MTTPQTKLQDYLKSVPEPVIALAINAILGSLVINCSEEDMDTAIVVARELVKEKEEKYEPNNTIL